ncbi:MAG: hypothetical protein JWM57_1826 [Phycisphaerales bacterium]|nr:hypothetical protein [Phycisphaerales bacterium]
MRLKKMTALALITMSTLAGSAFARGGATIKGVVNGDNHRPTGKAEVYLLHHEKGDKKYTTVDSTTTDADGEFAFGKVDDGTYIILARAGKLRDRSEVTIHDGRDPAELSFTLQAGKARERAADDEDAAVTSRAKREYVNYVGQVVGKDKDAVTGATVRLLDEDGKKEIESVTSEKKGRFEFYKVPLGRYILDVQKGKLHVAQKVTLTETDGTESIQIPLR